MGVTSDDQIPIHTNPDFIPIMSMYANVSLVKWIQEGQSVSYGRHFRSRKNQPKWQLYQLDMPMEFLVFYRNQGFEVLITR